MSIENNIANKIYTHVILHDQGTNNTRKPKYKKGDPCHVLYPDGTYNAVNVISIVSCKNDGILYEFDYNFGTSNGYAYECNLFLRDKDDFRSTAKIPDMVIF